MGSIPRAPSRGGGQAVVIGLMIVAFLILVIARTQSPVGSAGATLPPSVPGSAALESARSTDTPASTPSDSPSVEPTDPGPTDEPTEPAATDAPTDAPSADASAGSGQTYKVRSGDTLSSIAARFSTTVKKLSALNGITDPRFLKIGQVLQIP